MHSGATEWPLPAASASACHGCGHRAAGGQCPPAPLYPWCGGARRAVACLGSQKSRAKAAARRWRALDFCQPRPIATQRGGTLRRRTAARNAGRIKVCGQKSTPRALFCPFFLSPPCRGDDFFCGLAAAAASGGNSYSGAYAAPAPAKAGASAGLQATLQQERRQALSLS